MFKFIRLPISSMFNNLCALRGSRSKLHRRSSSTAVQSKLPKAPSRSISKNCEKASRAAKRRGKWPQAMLAITHKEKK